MRQPTKLQYLGALLLLIGTAVGAGMLALPLLSAQAGFLPAVILLIAVWALMTYTALLVLEVNLAFKAYSNNFGTMAKHTLGRTGQFIAWASCLLLLYALSSAYIAGNASLVAEGSHLLFGTQLPNWLNALLFIIVFGSAVFWSTRATDILNRALMSIKGLAVSIMLVLLMPHVQFTQLVNKTDGPAYLVLAAPVFLTAFGFHTVIPSLSNYLGPRVNILQRIILLGTIIPLVIYIIWLICALGVIPLDGAYSYHHIHAHHGSVGAFVRTIDTIAHERWVTVSVNIFADVAMTTSFLGVTLGLFDFLADAFKRGNHRLGRLQTAMLTYIPPFIFAVFYPKGFIMALGYAAIFVAILEIIIPALMVHKLRRSTTLSSPYRAPGGTITRGLVMLCGVALIAAQLISNWHLVG